MSSVKKPSTETQHATMSGIPLKGCYGPEDLESRGWTYEEQLGAKRQYKRFKAPLANCVQRRRQVT